MLLDLNGLKYEVAQESLLPAGKRAWTTKQRPSQTSDPSTEVRATWRVSGGIGASREDVAGFLGVNSVDNLDTRNEGLLTSTAARNAVTMSALDPASGGLTLPFTIPATLGGTQIGNIRHMTEQNGRLVFSRGSVISVVDPSTMTLKNTIPMPGIIQGMESWKGKTRIGFGSTSQMITIDRVGDSLYGTTATSKFAKAMTVGDQRWWGISGDVGGGTENRVFYSQDDFSTFSTPFQVGDDRVAATGLGTAGPYAIAGSETGAFAFTEAGKPVRLLETLTNLRASGNGVSIQTLWGWTYIVTQYGLFAVDLASRYSTIANPVGPEVIPGFEGSANGYPTYVKAFKDSLWVAYYTTGGDTYVFRGMFGPRTADTGIPIWYPFVKLSGVRCDFIGGTALRTNPTLILGEGTNLSYYTLGRLGRDIADPNYGFSTGGGTWWGTTLTREPDKAKNLRYAILHTENCNASNFWQLAVSINGGAYVNIGSAVTTNGQNYLRPVDGSSVPLTTVNGLTVEPRLTQVAGSSSAPPQVRSVTLVYDERPDNVDVHIITLNGSALRDFRTNKANLDALADQRNTPVACILPGENVTRYAMVEEIGETDLKGDGVRGITVQFSIWETV